MTATRLVTACLAILGAHCTRPADVSPPRPAASPAADAPARADAVPPEPGAEPPGPGPLRTCYCTNWVHLDQHGEACLPRAPACEAQRAELERGFRQTTACERVQRPRCESFWCEGSGAECYRVE